MSIAAEVQALYTALEAAGWVTRYAVREMGTGDLVAVIDAPAVDDLGYSEEAPCPPGWVALRGAVQLIGPTADEAGARGALLEALDRIAADLHAAGWTPTGAEPTDIADRPAYQITVTRRARP